jgi:predicted transcriptional regulator
VSKINSILEILRDGKLHRITDLQIEINIDHFEMQKILAFLQMFEFVEIVNNKEVITKQSFGRLLSQCLI